MFLEEGQCLLVIGNGQMEAVLNIIQVADAPIERRDDVIHILLIVASMRAHGVGHGQCLHIVIYGRLVIITSIGEHAQHAQGVGTCRKPVVGIGEAQRLAGIVGRAITVGLLISPHKSLVSQHALFVGERLPRLQDVLQRVHTAVAMVAVISSGRRSRSKMQEQGKKYHM